MSVFVSYCATDLAGSGGGSGDVINNIFGNNNTLISPILAGANGTGTTNSSLSGGGGGGSANDTILRVHGSAGNALCNTCPNSVGICCPPTVECDDDDGKCPAPALEMSGNTINGYLIAQVMNSTAPVEGKRRVRARVRVKTREEKALSKERDSIGLREEVAGRHGHGHGHGHGDQHGHTHGHGRQGQKKKTKGTRRAHRKQF